MEREDVNCMTWILRELAAGAVGSDPANDAKPHGTKPCSPSGAAPGESA